MCPQRAVVDADMVVEHSFVTVLDRERALERAAVFLDAIGFQPQQREQAWLSMRRGKRSPHPRDLATLPQSVRLEFDRGRVTVAAGIMEFRKVNQHHRDLMLSIVGGLEMLLAVDRSPAEARVSFDEASERITVDDRRRRRNRRITMAGLLALIAAIVGLSIWALSSL